MESNNGKSEWKMSNSPGDNGRMLYQVYRWNGWDLDPEVVFSSYDEENTRTIMEALNSGELSIKELVEWTCRISKC